MALQVVRSLGSVRLRLDNSSAAAARIFDIKLGNDSRCGKGYVIWGQETISMDRRQDQSAQAAKMRHTQGIVSNVQDTRIGSRPTRINQ